MGTAARCQACQHGGAARANIRVRRIGAKLAVIPAARALLAQSLAHLNVYLVALAADQRYLRHDEQLAKQLLVLPLKHLDESSGSANRERSLLAFSKLRLLERLGYCLTHI